MSPGKEHFEDEVIQFIRGRVGEIPNNARIPVGVANKICPTCANFGGREGAQTLVVDIERGIKIIFRAWGFK